MDYLDAMPNKTWPNFNLGNHDKSRLASRVGDSLLDALNMVYMLLPGTPIHYYGDEIGMVDGTNVRESGACDKFRDAKKSLKNKH